jgi:death on curing protein
MDDPKWIEGDEVIAIHGRQLAEHGGAEGLRDSNLLQSALARPRQLFAYSDPTADLSMLAAAYAFGIAKNHPFVDGNKRTAAVVCETFIMLNGADLTADDADMTQMFLQLAAGDVSEDQLALWIRANIRTIG